MHGPQSVAVIVVGRRDVSERIARVAGADRVVTFASFEELDRWRNEGAPREEAMIRCDLNAILELLNIRTGSLPEKLRAAVESLADEPRVPALAIFEARWSSRRSFY